METIGQRIRRLRKTRDLRQIDFAQMCDMGQSTMSDIESKNREFSAAQLYTIAKKLDVSTDEIMFGTQGEIVGQSELLRLFAELSPDQRETVLIVARGLRESNQANKKAA